MGGGTRDRAAAIVVNALGPLEVMVHGTAVSLPPAQRRLLSVLLVDADRDVSTEELIDRMWPHGPPATARTAVQVHVSGLRKVVPVSSTSTGYRLSLDGIVHDRVEFERLVVAAETARDEQRWADARTLATDAQTLWRGDPYPDLADGTESSAFASWLRELSLDAADVEVEALLALGHNDGAVQRLRSLIDRHPLQDRLRHQLMLGLYRSGRQEEALREFQAYRKLLGETLGIEPGVDLRTLEEQILVHDPFLGTRPDPPNPHNLPRVATSFVGRESERRRIIKELEGTRLVTVTGPPGIGKTRLATEIGAEVLEAFPGGVWLAGLAGTRTVRDVLATIGAALSVGDGIDIVEALAESVDDRPLLLILDNCEHVLEPVRRFLAALTSRAGACRVLATSRQPIAVAGEFVHRLEPLPARVDGAVALLVDRVRAVDRNFVVTAENLDGLVALCERLEGVPLSIELVARFVPTFGVADTARLLDEVAGENALEMAFDWGTALLHESDRTLLYHLAVFESSFTLERAHQVCGLQTEIATAGSVSRLVDASLLALDGRSPRYRMLQPFRELAWARAEPAIRPVLANRHAEAIAAASADMRQATLDARQASAFAAFDAEIGDYRKALAWFRDAGRWGPMTTILEALARYWYARFLAWEATAWLDEIPDAELSREARIRVHRVAGFLAWATHDYDGADTHYTALLELGRASDDRLAEADALFGRGSIHQKRRFLDGAAMLREAAVIYEELGGRELELGQCLLFRGLDEAYTGDVAVAEAALGRASALLEQVGHLRQVSKTERWLAHCAWRRRNEADARCRADRAERIARALGDHIALGGALVEQATIDVTWGSPAAAAQRLIEALGPIPEVDEVDISQVLIPVARLAGRTGHRSLLAAVLAHIDEIYSRYGWRPLDEADGIAELRKVVEDMIPDCRGVLSRVDEFLGSLAAEAESLRT
jgi:predicted ATPase/DNA-binding SARP family transcriptional activator